MGPSSLPWVYSEAAFAEAVKRLVSCSPQLPYILGSGPMTTFSRRGQDGPRWRAIFELARLVDYTPRPGVSGSVPLATFGTACVSNEALARLRRRRPTVEPRKPSFPRSGAAETRAYARFASIPTQAEPIVRRLNGTSLGFRARRQFRP
jgi:hypothetical protein